MGATRPASGKVQLLFSSACILLFHYYNMPFFCFARQVVSIGRTNLIYVACVWAMRLLLNRRQAHSQHYFFYKLRTPCLQP